MDGEPSNPRFDQSGFEKQVANDGEQSHRQIEEGHECEWVLKTIGELMGFVPKMYPYVLTGYVLAVVIVVLISGPYSFHVWEITRPPSAR